MGTRIKRLFLSIETTRNWPIVLLVWFGLKKSCKAKFRNGYQQPLTKQTWEEYLEGVYLFHHFPDAVLSSHSVTFTYKKQKLVFNYGNYGIGTILEIFGGEPYKEFFDKTKIMGKDVLDIGAAFGDTAITFLLAGAKHVYAVEAFPGYCKLAEENITTNGFSDRCDVILSAVGANPGQLRINGELKDMFSLGTKEAMAGELVQMVTLGQLVERYNINQGVLKLDVEGYEYEILLNAPREVLRRFSDMVIEYHYGYERLERCLTDAGFSVIHTPPHLVYMSQLEGEEARNMNVGNIYASLQDA